MWARIGDKFTSKEEFLEATQEIEGLEKPLVPF